MTQKKVDNFIYKNESYKIRGACFKVYNTLGGGIKEKIIERALIKELKDCGFQADNQVRIDIVYSGEKIGVYIPDIIVNNKIIIVIEIKAKPFINKEDEKQFWGYLKNSNYYLGFIVNFGHQKLIIKRFIHTGKLSA